MWASALLVLLAGCLRFVRAPPERYDYPFPGEVVVRQLSAADAEQACRFSQIIPGREGAGCMWREGPRCVVVISASTPNYAATLRHEVAHCNGWPEDHPSE